MKWVVGILIGAGVLLFGLFVVFRFVVRPRSSQLTASTTVKPPSAAPPAAQPVTDSTAQRLAAVGALASGLAGGLSNLGIRF